MRPTLKQLDYLIALKNEGSFSRAAEFCNVTQSTLSAGIKELETVLGQILVDRSSRDITLTPLGEDVHQQALKIMRATDQLVATAKSREEPLSGVLRLGVIPTIAPYMLPSLLPALQTEFPKLQIQLFEDMTGRLIERLMRRQIDLILMAFPYEQDGMETRMLFEEPFVIAAPKGVHHQQAVELPFLDDKSVLLLEDGHCLRDHALQACKLRSNTSEKRTFSATSLPTLIQMISHGYGLTLLPEMAVRQAVLPDNIEIIPFSDPQPTRHIGLGWRKGDVNARDYKALSQMIEKLQNT